MKTRHRYRNALLTVLTLCLIGIFIQNQLLLRELQRKNAGSNGNPDARFGAYQVRNPAPGYALVPVNPDGSINVRLAATSETMNVNVHQVNGYPIGSNHLPVRADLLDVNLKKIDGESVYQTSLPVRTGRLDVNVEAINGCNISGCDLPVSGN